MTTKEKRRQNATEKRRRDAAEKRRRTTYTIAAQERYHEKIEISKVTANPTTEPEIYEWLVSRENKSGAIKELIYKEIKRLARKDKTAAEKTKDADEDK